MKSISSMLHSARSIALTAVIMTALVSYSAPTTSWNGLGDGTNWFDGANWSDGLPATGNAVTVPSGTILLTNETPVLASFTMTGGTLTCSNWTTRLRADTVVISGGTVTLPPAFTEQEMSNRVWIVCSDFTLDAGGTINVEGRGYASNNGPGCTDVAISGVWSNGGGGYGGKGSPGSLTWNAAGPTYGSAVLPFDPGSGGAAVSHATAVGGKGGGAVWIDAANNVLLNGIINASGTAGTAQHGGGGSGGSILIQGETITGNGALKVVGGNKSGGGGEGGGGRIALRFSPSVQTTVPGMTVMAGGAGGLAEMGTLYVPQLDVMLASGVFPPQWDKVNLHTPEFSQWELPSLSVSKMIGLPDVRVLKVAGEMDVKSGGTLSLSSGSEVLATDFYGLLIEVGGELSIAGGGTLALRSDPTNDVAPYLECGQLTVYTNGTISANALGFGPGLGISPGTGPINGYKIAGGGHGGSGGAASGWGTGGSPYGFAHRPWHSGSGGGPGGPDGSGGYGGGAICIRVLGTALIGGTISANGMTTPKSQSGGGAGGTILLTAMRLEGDGGLLSANGGGSSGTLSGAGGGGRIAVLTPSLPPEVLEALAVEMKPGKLVEVLPTSWDATTGTATFDSERFSGVATVTAGVAINPGTPGSVFFGNLQIGTVIVIW